VEAQRAEIMAAAAAAAAVPVATGDGDSTAAEYLAEQQAYEEGAGALEDPEP
jgi:hypothetical protein